MTFNALQSGDVDGQCYGYIGFRAMKFNEANQRYLPRCTTPTISSRW